MGLTSVHFFALQKLSVLYARQNSGFMGLRTSAKRTRVEEGAALRVRQLRTHKLECTRCLLRVLADFSVHGVKTRT